ncbi:MAG: Dynamin family protein [Desulfatitalea sp.]|nr:dynamin family protein [Desulfatitalea sp.]NNK01490.1 Dynamin family protein [Desulfatitalea sp.]
MYRDNYINALRSEMLEMVAEKLTPVAMRYGYSDVPLETTIKWRPQVLVLGSYSSGKSTLINDFLGAKVQATGQAPTDDSFTVITYDDSLDENAPVQVTESRDGKYLLNDNEYPFETLKKHGQRFASHFRLKKVNSAFLKHLAIIDTPGMLDSITERDRGYNYQEVIGDLAQIADLVLVLFDPHKAGTVREIHTSLRDTLPARTFEDRVLFVLNRIDECASMIDLLRVYGTLCWNLSQITGRKDIPMIHLSYSLKAAAEDQAERDLSYLSYLENQREELKKAVMQAPHYRLDNLAAFVETHGERLAHLLEALTRFYKRRRKFKLKSAVAATGCGLAAGVAIFVLCASTPPFSGLNATLQLTLAGAATLAVIGIWRMSIHSFLFGRFRKNTLKNVDRLAALTTQTRRDNWESIRTLVINQIRDTSNRYSLGEARREYNIIWRVYERGSKEIREALRELEDLSDSKELDFVLGNYASMDQSQSP